MANCGVPQKTSLTRLPFPGPLQFANLAQHEIALQSTDAEDEENSVQVVDLMLEGPGQQVVRFPFKPITLEILGANFYFGSARDFLPDVGQTQTALLFKNLSFLAHHLRIDQGNL